MTPEFRVWNKETKKYATSTRLFGFIESDDSFKFALISLFSGVFEWYTGLKDVNGDKIFEGDIVSISNHPFQKHKGDLTGIYIEGNYEINWSERDLSWLAGMWKCSETRQYLTVIGNIHENPELLEVE